MSEIRLNLNDELKEKITYLQDILKIKTRTELVRTLITNKYLEVIKLKNKEQTTSQT